MNSNSVTGVKISTSSNIIYRMNKHPCICMATSSKCNGNSTTLSTGPQSPPKLLQQQSFITNSFIHNNNNNNYQYLHHQSIPPAELNQMMMMMEERKRGLSRTQIDWMERSFQEDEGKPLEPERKLKLSQDLGLHPRQVSIWFQNRRARWKNKQLQQHYHSLQQENQNLRYEVMQLRAKLGHLEMEKQKAGESDDRYMEAPFIIAQDTGESKSSVINNQSSNNRIMLQDDHDAHYKQLKLLAEDHWTYMSSKTAAFRTVGA